MVRVDVDLLDRIAFACRKYPDRAVDITQSFKYNQITSKATVQRLLPPTPSKICVLGGWYGLGFMCTATNISNTYTCIDIDPHCQLIGETLDQPNFYFVTANALEYDVSEFDIIINCSTEHMDRRELKQSFVRIPNHTMCIFQNNNNFNVEDHINCFDNIELFEDFISEDFAILETVVDKMDNRTERYTILCRKM